MNGTNPHLQEDDLALFALALMSPEEAAFARAHLKHCDLCREEVARLQGDLVVYAFTADLQAPPPESKARLLDAIGQEKRLHAPAPVLVQEPVLAPRSTNLLDRPVREIQPRHRGMGVFGWAGWALAACMAAVAGWQFTDTQILHVQLAEQDKEAVRSRAEAEKAERVYHVLTDPAVMQVSLHVPVTGGAAKPEAHTSYNVRSGELVFVATHLQAVDADKTYELWVLPANGDAPVPAGTFKPDGNGNASLVLPELPKHVAAKGFGVTLEAEGGSQTPTLPILLLGT